MSIKAVIIAQGGDFEHVHRVDELVATAEEAGERIPATLQAAGGSRATREPSGTSSTRSRNRRSDRRRIPQRRNDGRDRRGVGGRPYQRNPRQTTHPRRVGGHTGARHRLGQRRCGGPPSAHRRGGGPMASFAWSSQTQVAPPARGRKRDRPAQGVRDEVRAGGAEDENRHAHRRAGARGIDHGIEPRTRPGQAGPGRFPNSGNAA